MVQYSLKKYESLEQLYNIINDNIFNGKPGFIQGMLHENPNERTLINDVVETLEETNKGGAGK